MCGGKKGATTTTSSQTQASPEAMAAYRDILSRATTAADTPYTAYTGDRVAGFSPDQQAAFQATRDAQGIASPYLSEATTLARAGSAPIDATAIERYQNPYQSSVIDATMRDLQQQNAIAQSQVTGNAALRGALGGSRVGVAQALTAGEQARTQASTLANLYSSGYDKALAAAQQDRSASSAGASLMAGLGDASSTAAYRDVASLYGMGQQQQGNQQAGLDAAYQQWVQQQAYPTQQISWLSDVAGRAGAGMGTSTSGTSTAPPPNPWNAILGAAGTVAGAALGGPMGASAGGKLGSAVGSSFADGGVVKGYADGGLIDNDPANPLIDLSLDNSGAYSMGGSESMPTEMAGMEGTPSGGFNWQSLGNPLMQAGFKMMASQSPYLGVAIGEGGLAGTKAYADNAKVDADKKHKEELIKVQRERLEASMKAQREKTEAANEQTRYTWGRDEHNRLVRLPMRGDEEPRVVDSITMAPVGRGAAGGAPGSVERIAAGINADREARGLPKYSYEDAITRARRGRADAEVSAVAERLALAAYGDGSRSEFPTLAAARKFYGLDDVPSVAPRREIPAPPPGPAITPPVEGPGRFAPARALPLPREIPAAPGPLPREVPAAAVPARPPGFSDAQLMAKLNENVEAARAAGDTGKVNELMARARAWGIVK